VHGLGVDPADDALFIATHTGLFRVAEGESKAKRVGDRYQDTMGFTVVGPHRFLGSGHPDLRDDLPPLLGLIGSSDAGASWEPVSLLGEADFHVLRFSGGRIYGYDSSRDRLLTSADRGGTWQETAKPGQLVDLAIDPAEPDHIVVSTLGGAQEGLFESRDGGESWTPVSKTVGLLAWSATAGLYLVSRDGRVFASRNAGRTIDRRGQIDGEPAALLADGEDELFVALHDGTIQHSADAGATWRVWSKP
jgi:photosystem II stability/assembly factor-like uncharacterized protein